jgi:hypothetical protein
MPLEHSTVQALSDTFGGAREVWGAHPQFGVADWQAEVAADTTRRGYWNWVHAQVEALNDPASWPTHDELLETAELVVDRANHREFARGRERFFCGYSSKREDMGWRTYKRQVSKAMESIASTLRRE